MSIVDDIFRSAYGSKSGTNLTSNPDSATVGSPSTYPEALSVASISGQKSPYLIGNKGTGAESFIFFTEASDGNGNEKDFVKEMLAAAGKNENDEVTLEYVQVGLYGRVAGYNGVDVKGKIALIQRGGKPLVGVKASGDYWSSTENTAPSMFRSQKSQWFARRVSMHYMSSQGMSEKSCTCFVRAVTAF